MPRVLVIFTRPFCLKSASVIAALPKAPDHHGRRSSLPIEHIAIGDTVLGSSDNATVAQYERG